MSETNDGPSKATGWGYPDAEIPAWCRLPLSDHHDGLGGCWGIAHGLVRETKGKHCEGCEDCDLANYRVNRMLRPDRPLGGGVGDERHDVHELCGRTGNLQGEP